MPQITTIYHKVNKNSAAYGVASALANDVSLLADAQIKGHFDGRPERMDELRERIQGHWDWIYDWMTNEG